MITSIFREPKSGFAIIINAVAFRYLTEAKGTGAVWKYVSDKLPVCRQASTS